MNTSRMQEYVSLIRSFLDRKITALDFERQYLDTFKKETPGMTIAEFEVLDTLFGAADAFCADPSLRSDEDLDEDQLRTAAKSALDQLLKM